MRTVAAILLIGMIGVWPALREARAEPPDTVNQRTITREKVSDYAEAAAKRRKFRACVQSGAGECRTKYRQALRWCLEHPDKCFLLTEGAGASAPQYAAQEAAKCRRVLERKCRSEAGL